MSLEDIYSQSVQGKTVSGLPSIGTAAPPIIQRDPKIRKLEQDVFAQIHEIATKDDPAPEAVQPEIQHISFEDALKELADGN